MIAFFLNNICAKYYKNPSMLSRVVAKNVGDDFLRHSVYSSLFTNSGKEVRFYSLQCTAYGSSVSQSIN